MSSLIGMSHKLNRDITWGDSSVEHVTIDKDGHFILNGVKRNLLGLDMGYNGFVNGTYGRYYETGNPAIMEAELAWMQTQGIRIVHMVFPHESGLTTHFSTALDLFYQHKMLVIPQLVLKWETKFDPPTENFLISGANYRDDFVAGFANTVSAYDNVVALCIENEINYSYAAAALNYTASQAATYIKQCRAIVKGYTNIPFTTKVMTYFDNAHYNSIELACLPFTDIACYDSYESSVANFDTAFNTINGRISTYGLPSYHWQTEFGTPTGNDPSAPAMTAAMITNAFEEGAALVILFVANRNFGAQDSDWAFFDAAGDPIANILGGGNVDIPANIAAWQVSI